MATKQRPDRRLVDIDTDLIRKLQQRGSRIPVSHTKMRAGFEGKLAEAADLRRKAYSPGRPLSRRPRLLGLVLSVLTLGLYPRV